MKINENYKLFRSINNLTINSKSAQNTSIRLINNIKSFLSLRKKSKEARFPSKFKSYRYFTSFMLDYNNGCGGFKINELKLEINLNSLKNKLIIDLPNYANDISNENIKTVTIKREDDNYYVIFVYGEVRNTKSFDEDNYLSLDLGFSRLLTGCSKNGNIKIEGLKQKKLNDNISNTQSTRDKYKRGSRRYKKINNSLKRKKKKLKNISNDFIHKSSRKIINYCLRNNVGRLIVGDIKVSKVIKKENKMINGLSKSTGNLGRFKTFLEYKSKNEGIEFVLINEACTSKTNCITNVIEFNSDLSNRYFNWEDIFIDRDLNSAINILKKPGQCLSQDQIKGLLLNNISELNI